MKDKPLRIDDGAYLIEKIPHIGRCNTGPGNMLSLECVFEKTPSFLCCRTEDIQKAEKFSKVPSDKVLRAIRLPEGTQYKDIEDQSKTAGPGGVFIVEQQWLECVDNYLPPFNREAPYQLRRAAFFPYEAEEFNKRFSPERKSDISDKKMTNTIRFLGTIEKLKDAKGFSHLKKICVLGFLLRPFKFHQMGRIKTPISQRHEIYSSHR